MNEWKLSEVWNEATLNRDERPIVAREHIWASELGKGMADIILKMRGEVPTNPPNARSKRKFEAGNVFEWIIYLVLVRSGILQSTQERVTHQYPGLLEVTGKIDFEAGGIPHYDEAIDEIKSLELPDVINRGTMALVNHLKEKYPLGLQSKIIEVKSVSAFMFDALESNKRSSRNHRLQVTHYLKCKNYDSGVIIYICRDDLRMFEVEVFLSDHEEEYRQEIEEITRIYKSGEMPPLEAEIIYDEDTERFSKNWQVAYSMYLTKLYGIENQLEFDERYQPIAASWNGVLNRMRRAAARERWLKENKVTESDVLYEKIEGKRTKKHYISTDDGVVYLPDNITKSYEMTPKNLEIIKAMQSEGFDPYELASRMKNAIEDNENIYEE